MQEKNVGVAKKLTFSLFKKKLNINPVGNITLQARELIIQYLDIRQPKRQTLCRTKIA